MSSGENVGAAAPLLPRRKQHREGCPGCRLDEINKTKTGIPYLNFFYIWVVCLTACKKSLLISLSLSLTHISSLFFGTLARHVPGEWILDRHPHPVLCVSLIASARVCTYVRTFSRHLPEHQEIGREAREYILVFHFVEPR
jgi:hypothetical protein